jgi:hypothetical protein
MDAQTVFYSVSSICLLLITGFFLFVFYEVVKTLRLLRILVSRLDSFSLDVQRIKHTLKIGILGFAYNLLGGRLKGGDRYES